MIKLPPWHPDVKATKKARREQEAAEKAAERAMGKTDREKYEEKEWRANIKARMTPSQRVMAKSVIHGRLTMEAAARIQRMLQNKREAIEDNFWGDEGYPGGHE